MNLSIFAERLSELIFDNKISSSYLAQEIKCDRSTITRYLSGNKMPTIDLCCRIADYFKCSLDFLFGLEENNYPQSYSNYIPFSERLPFLLSFFDISRYRLEKITGISESTLFYWSKGQTKPTIENIIKIAKSLNTSIDFILGRITV